MKRIAAALLGIFFATTDPAPGETMQPDRNLVDFAAENSEWFIVNDGVMGGLSGSSMQRTGQGTGLFAGDLSLENNGGFASVRATIGPVDLSGADGLAIRVRGDGRTYQVRLRVDGGFDGVAYRAEFATRTGEWLTVDLPFDDFQPTFRGRILRDAPPLDTTRITQLGFLLADKNAGEFSLEIGSVKTWNREGAR